MKIGKLEGALTINSSNDYFELKIDNYRRSYRLKVLKDEVGAQLELFLDKNLKIKIDKIKYRLLSIERIEGKIIEGKIAYSFILHHAPLKSYFTLKERLKCCYGQNLTDQKI